MKKIILKRILIILTLSVSFFGYSQKKPVAIGDITDTKQILENLRNATGANHIALSIIADGKTQTVHYVKNQQGKTDEENSNALFEIGSVTKTFTGLLIAKAVTEGKISLNDDIRKYLDGSYPNLEYNGSPITIKDLLVFKTGINRDFPNYGTLLEKRDETTPFKIKALEDNYTKQQFFEDLKNAKVELKPGTVYVHTKLGPELCAMILEKVYKKSYETLVDDFLKSAGMASSRLHLKNGENTVEGYNENNKLMPIIADGLWGAAGMMKATPADMVKYMEYQIDPKNADAIESHKLLSEGTDGDFAYCWYTFKDQEGKAGYWMHGGTFGTQNLVIIYPAYHLGFSIIVNQNGPDTFQALHEAHKALENQLKPGKKSIIREIRKQYPSNIKRALTYYDKLKKTNTFYVDEEETNSYGYSLLWDKKPEEALQVFDLYVTEFPKSANGYDSRGEVYFTLKNYTASRKDYEKSLQLNPGNNHAKEMLEKLKSL